MLSLFPQILFLSPFVGTILRVTIALSLLYHAYAEWTRREEIGRTKFVIVGAPGSWAIALSAIVDLVVATGLFVGYWTQGFAILAGIMFFKRMVLAKKYPRAIPLCGLDYFYLVIMCVCVLLIGAGPFAFDLPL